MMEKKQLRTIFLYEFKLGHKAAEATRNINSTFGQGTANEHTMQRWFQKFRNGDESLEDEEDRRRPSAVDNDELKVLVETDSRTTIRELDVKLDILPKNKSRMSESGTGERERSDEKTDPGAIRHGNFMNYYQFHPAEERVRQLPRGVWQRQRVAHPARKYAGLDVGCNAGDLTYILRDFLEEAMLQEQPEISLIGVDLDPILIEKARERNPRPDCVTFERLDFLSEGCGGTLGRYLAQLNKTRFDVVFCFSITMWIHLNHGDDGLEAFLRKACELAEMIVVEPQPWKCYRNASRRLRRAKLGDFPLLKELKYTGSPTKHIEDILKLCDFRKVTTVTTGSKWGRTLLIYERKQES